MSEKVIIPEAKTISTISRTKPSGKKSAFKPYRPGPNGVCPMPAIGEGYKVHVTGLTHDERGYPVMSVDTQKEMMHRLLNKIRNNLDDIIMTESHFMDDAEYIIVSYGVSARTSYTAVEMARNLGIKAGLLRLITVWPFPETIIRNLAKRVKGFVTVEINMGQICREVERCAGSVPSFGVGHPGGAIIPPDDVIKMLKEAF
jgi:2-oxoglutarate/2-oxoacid ferredoxin oxidoreductase subunit alpha